MVEAKGQYQIVVDEYIKRGKVRDAGDVLKKMADIDPSDLKVRSKLADLYTARRQLGTRRSRSTSRSPTSCTKKGHLAEALQVLEKGLKIDAKSARLRCELARIHLVQKNYEKAVAVPRGRGAAGPRRHASMLAASGRGLPRAPSGSTRPKRIFKRLLEQRPERPGRPHPDGPGATCCRASSTQAFEQFLPVVDKLVERKEGERAAALLQQIIQSNAAHVKSLTKLVEVYRLPPQGQRGGPDLLAAHRGLHPARARWTRPPSSSRSWWGSSRRTSSTRASSSSSARARPGAARPAPAPRPAAQAPVPAGRGGLRARDRRAARPELRAAPRVRAAP